MTTTPMAFSHRSCGLYKCSINTNPKIRSMKAESSAIGICQIPNVVRNGIFRYHPARTMKLSEQVIIPAVKERFFIFLLFSGNVFNGSTLQYFNNLQNGLERLEMSRRRLINELMSNYQRKYLCLLNKGPLSSTIQN